MESDEKLQTLTPAILRDKLLRGDEHFELIEIGDDRYIGQITIRWHIPPLFVPVDVPGRDQVVKMVHRYRKSGRKVFWIAFDEIKRAVPWEEALSEDYRTSRRLYFDTFEELEIYLVTRGLMKSSKPDVNEDC